VRATESVLPWSVDTALIVVWASLTAILLARLARSVWVLRSRERTWRTAMVDGVRVKVSDDTGPAVIGIDPMAATTSSLEVGTPSVADAVIAALGLVRVASTIAPDLIQPPGTAYTAEERRRTAAMTNWNYGNPSISDEWSQIGANSTKTAAQPFAPDLPVLEMLSTESVDTMPAWLPNHEAELEGVTTHQLEVLDGAHYLHWTQSPALARLITDFVTAQVNP